jgi:integrase
MSDTPSKYAAKGGAKALTTPYLRLRFGRPEYRRRVPGWLRPVVGVREWVIRLPDDPRAFRAECAILTARHDRLCSSEVKRLVRAEVDIREVLLASLMPPLPTPEPIPLPELMALPPAQMREQLIWQSTATDMAVSDQARYARLQPVRDAWSGVEPAAPDANPVTFGEVVRAWRKGATLAETSVRAYWPRIDRALEFFGATLPADTLTPAMVREFRDKVATLPGPAGMPRRLRTAPMGELLAYAAANPGKTTRVLPGSVNDHLKALAAVCQWAVGEGMMTSNPVKGVKLAKDTRPVSDTMQGAIDWRDMPAFMAALRACDGAVARCLEFVTLTAVRANQAEHMDWAEIDHARKVWTCPAGRVKGSREAHTVPLTDAALACLGTPGTGLVFGRLPANAMLNLLKRHLGQPAASVHGMRSAFSTWAHESTEYEHEMIEHAIAHKVGTSVSRRYQRESMVEKRREMMADWAHHLAAGVV